MRIEVRYDRLVFHDSVSNRGKVSTLVGEAVRELKKAVPFEVDSYEGNNDSGEVHALFKDAMEDVDLEILADICEDITDTLETFGRSALLDAINASEEETP